MTEDELRRRLGMGPSMEYDLQALRLAYTASRHEPLRIYLGDFRWTVFTVDRAIDYGNRLMTEMIDR